MFRKNKKVIYIYNVCICICAYILHTCWVQKLLQGSTLVFILFIINTVPYACYEETCPWYAFRGQGITLWSWFSPFISEWNSGPQTGEAISLTCLATCGPSLFSETTSLTCAMHGLGKTGWPESPEASMCLSLQCWGCGCLFPEGSGSWTQNPMLAWPTEPVL